MAATAEQVTAEPGLNGTARTRWGRRISLQPCLQAGLPKGVTWAVCWAAGGYRHERGSNAYLRRPIPWAQGHSLLSGKLSLWGLS